MKTEPAGTKKGGLSRERPPSAGCRRPDGYRTREDPPSLGESRVVVVAVVARTFGRIFGLPVRMDPALQQ